MKKHNTLRIAALLLVLVMVTTCAVSGTFAKYVTGANGTDSARVAKWGVTVAVTNADGFKDTYAVEDDTAITAASSITLSVDSVDNADVVAPGTEGTLASYTITGTPEVETLTTVTANLALTGWTIPAPTDADPDATAYYCPIVITVDGTAYNGNNYDNMAAFETAVEAALNNSGTYAAPNADIAATHTVSWAWNFENATGQDNVKDTALGNLTTAPTIAFSLEVGVTQVN